MRPGLGDCAGASLAAGAGGAGEGQGDGAGDGLQLGVRHLDAAGGGRGVQEPPVQADPQAAVSGGNTSEDGEALLTPSPAFPRQQFPQICK